MKKIISLTNAFVKEYYQSLPIFDTSKNKFNKKSIFYWLIVIIFFGVSYISYEIIKFLIDIGQKELFIGLYLPILLVFLVFQAIISCANIFFFSKETINVLHMPIKPFELLISKLNTLLLMLYCTEGVLAIVPITLYGMLSSANIIYYLWSMVVILVYPIFISGVVSIFTFILMRFSKFIRNKEVFQVLTTILLIFLVLAIETVVTQKLFSIESNEQAVGQMIDIHDRLQNINKAFLIINPTINMLTNPWSYKALMSFVLVVAICSIDIITFLVIGKTTYLKDILKNLVSLGKKAKTDRKIDISTKIKSKKIAKAYIIKEVKNLIRNPSFFMQCVFPVLVLLINCIIIVVGIYPLILEAIQDESIKTAIDKISFNTEAACDILIVLQVMFSISNISLTAISREGKDANFIKYIPVELYKQFIYKNIPQFVLNLFITVIVLGLIWYIIPSINIVYMLFIFGISSIINLINCYLMLIVDLRRPNLNWSTEEAVVRKSDNKLFQYAFMIVNILILLYIATIFMNINITIALIIELIIYTILFIIIDRCVKRWQNKLFNKII